MKLIMVSLLLVAGGCASESYNELLERYEAECPRTNQTEECSEMNERLDNMEERKLRRLREKEQEEALLAFCKANEMILYCDSRGSDRRCQCATREAIQNILK